MFFLQIKIVLKRDFGIEVPKPQPFKKKGGYVRFFVPHCCMPSSVMFKLDWLGIDTFSSSYFFPSSSSIVCVWG